MRGAQHGTRSRDPGVTPKAESRCETAEPPRDPPRIHHFQKLPNVVLLHIMRAMLAHGGNWETGTVPAELISEPTPHGVRLLVSAQVVGSALSGESVPVSLPAPLSNQSIDL